MDLAVDDAPVQQRDSKAAWVTEPRQGARRPRAYVPCAASEPDHHERGVGWLESRRQPLTGSDMCSQASYRRKPPYVTLPTQGGVCVLQLGEASLTEARRWSLAFASHARRCFLRSHLHKCQPTCWKTRGAVSASTRVRVCRFGFWNEFYYHVMPRVPPEKRRCAQLLRRSCKLGRRARLLTSARHPRR